MQNAPAMKFRFLDWDSRHFGLRIGRVIPPRLDKEVLAESLAWANSASIDCMYLLLDSSDAASIRLAGASGWRMVDIRVTLSAASTDIAEDTGRVRAASDQDIPYLKQLARRSHRDSRFYADGNFSTEACDELFAIWIERSVREPDFAGAVFVPQVDDNRPAGYISCAVKNGLGEIGLIAVDEQVRRMGLGVRLLVQAARWCAGQGVTRISVVTQGCNIPALRMYARSAFAVESVELWFHWWRGKL